MLQCGRSPWPSVRAAVPRLHTQTALSVADFCRTLRGVTEKLKMFFRVSGVINKRSFNICLRSGYIVKTPKRDGKNVIFLDPLRMQMVFFLKEFLEFLSKQLMLHPHFHVFHKKMI